MTTEGVNEGIESGGSFFQPDAKGMLLTPGRPIRRSAKIGSELSGFRCRSILLPLDVQVLRSHVARQDGLKFLVPDWRAGLRHATRQKLAGKLGIEYRVGYQALHLRVAVALHDLSRGALLARRFHPDTSTGSKPRCGRNGLGRHMN